MTERNGYRLTLHSTRGLRTQHVNFKDFNKEINFGLASRIYKGVI